MAAARDPHSILIAPNKFVVMNLIKANFAGGLGTELGLTALTAPNFELPANSLNLGKGKKAALFFGCFAIVLVYARTATKFGQAKVLCAPSKADTVFANAKSKNYGTKNITEVKIPVRRVLVV